MLIDSTWVSASSGETFEVKTADSGAVIDSVPQGTFEDVQKAISAAAAAKHRMRGFPAHKRAHVLSVVAGRLEAEIDKLALLLARENGKPITQTREEIEAAARIFRGFGEEAKRLFGRTVSLDNVPGMENNFAMTIREPVGVVGAVIPFNYPVELYAHKIAAALAGGNAIIAKPPSACPLTLLRIAQIIEETELPRGAHQMITGSGTTIGTALAESDGVDLITVTGGTEAGRDISRRAAEGLKKVHLELGGNDPCIITEDADLERAADAIIAGRLARGNGQICCAVKRVYCQQSVVETFADILIEKTKNLKIGNPEEEDTDVGPLINEQAAVEVEKAINEAVKNGALVRIGGKRERAFIEPTVLTGVTPDALVLTKEIFGPVVPIVPYSTLDEAIDRANESDYGLQGAIFTNDISVAMNVAHRLEVGGVVVNWSSAVRIENLPFGGRKLSGHGVESIPETLLKMTEVKTIIFQDGLAAYRKAIKKT